MKGVSGSLLASDVLRQLASDRPPRERLTKVRSIIATALNTIGPASAARGALDALAAPLAAALDLRLANQVIGNEIAGAIEEQGSRIAVFDGGGSVSVTWEMKMVRFL